MAFKKFGDQSRITELEVGSVVQMQTVKKDEEAQPPKAQWRFGRFQGYLSLEDNAQMTIAFEGLPSLMFSPSEETLNIWVNEMEYSPEY